MSKQHINLFKVHNSFVAYSNCKKIGLVKDNEYWMQRHTDELNKEVGILHPLEDISPIAFNYAKSKPNVLCFNACFIDTHNKQFPFSIKITPSFCGVGMKIVVSGKGISKRGISSIVTDLHDVFITHEWDNTKG